jgi:hypothetical protein
MKLEFKHLAPYLPYNIEFLDNAKSETIIGWKDDRIYIDNCHKSGYCRIDEINTLLLRPLTDLNQELEINGETFIPTTRIFELFGMHYSFVFGGDIEHRITMYINGDWVEVSSFPYEIVNKLFEWHFDVFGLICEGLAVKIPAI